MLTLTLLSSVLILSSFSKTNVNQLIGTYGVCLNNPSQITLTLHSDQTFYYQDFSISDKKIRMVGSWTLKGNKVVLKGNKPEEKFHDTWTFDKHGQVAKSRKGLTYYRLTKTN